MSVKRADNNSYDKLEKFQSWRLYNNEINKPKINKYKAPSLSPKHKENYIFSPRQSNNFQSKNNGNNVLPSSGGYIYLNNNHVLKEKNKISIITPFKNLINEDEESKDHITELHDNTFSYKNMNNIHENIDINNLHNYSYQDKVERYSELTMDMTILSQHLKFIEIWVDLEISLDNKQLINAICNKYLKDFETEIIGKGLVMDIFLSASLNRTYNKILKIKLLLIYFLKFVITEFASYDVITIRTQIKRIIVSFSEIMASFIDIFVFYNANSTILSEYKILVDRISKLLKVNYSKKRNEDLFHINKSMDTTLNTLKILMNTMFSYSLFSAVHSVSFELIRSLDKLSTQKIGNFMIFNFLYGIMKKEEIRRPQKLNNNYNMHLKGQLLKIKTPYLPPSDDHNGYTLILDLDETLVHFFYTPCGGTFFLRPGALDFLKNLSDLYEIVIFTAGMKDYADNILDLIDPQYKLIKHRLYRHHTSLYGSAFVKDLSNIGRDLTKAIIIDNIPENFILQPNNGLGIKTWTHDVHDTQLFDLCKILKDIYYSKIQDIRGIIKRINEEVAKSIRTNVQNPYTNLDINQLLEKNSLF